MDENRENAAAMGEADITNESDQRLVRVGKLKALQAEGRDPFEIVRYNQTEHSAQITGDFEAYEGKDVSIAGRMLTRRIMGKASFLTLSDLEGRIQAYIRRDDVGEEVYDDFKKWDIGDIVGIKGFVFKTRTGEISVHAKEIILLSKALAPLPEKFHGLTNTDLRYRQRYVDLITGEGVLETFVKRSKILASIRNYLNSLGFLEVETPILVENAGGANARPFITHYNALNIDINLRISLELYLKRLIVGGMEKVYEIGRVFRNEGMDARHNPEFTLMELYQAYTDFHGMMELTENMFRHVALEVCGTTDIKYGEYTIDLGSPFKRVTMTECIKEYTGVDFDEIETLEQARAAADAHGVEYLPRHKRGDIMSAFFETFCEEKLIQPTFVTEHPIEISPLTKMKPDDPRLTQRFELFITSREMANAYSELNDPIDQRRRFEAQEELRRLGDEEANSIDEDFIHALEIGMPPTGGIGYGIDRLVMLLTDNQSIRDVLLFPTMKPLDN